MDPNVNEVLARISQYTGRRAISRYRFLAETCPPQAALGYQRALLEITRSTLDIQQYKLVLNAYNRHATAAAMPPMVPDETWLQDTQAESSRAYGQLETQLKTYTASLIKESIRMTYRDMAKHHRMTGDSNSALRLLNKAREYCSNSTQVAELSFIILDLAMDSHNHKLAEIHISKAEGALEAIANSKENKPDPSSKPTSYAGASTSAITGTDIKEKERAKYVERLNIARGLTALGQGQFKAAATALLRVGRDAGQYPGAEVLISPVDLAMYTTLCALATFTRQELKQKVIDNTELRSLLESEPQLKQVLNLFWQNKHRQVLQFLDDWQPTYRVDLYLSSHINDIIHQIQERAILQYFTPFSSVALTKASDAFGWPESKLQERVTHSIKQKALHAKLDLTNGFVLAHEEEPRVALFRSAVESADQLEHDTKAAMLRLMLIQADVLVKDPQSNNQSEASRGK